MTEFIYSLVLFFSGSPLNQYISYYEPVYYNASELAGQLSSYRTRRSIHHNNHNPHFAFDFQAHKRWLFWHAFLNSTQITFFTFFVQSLKFWEKHAKNTKLMFGIRLTEKWKISSEKKYGFFCYFNYVAFFILNLLNYYYY